MTKNRVLREVTPFLKFAHVCLVDSELLKLSETLSKTPTATPHTASSGNKWTIDSSVVNLPKYYSRGIFAQSEIESLLNLYSKMFYLSVSKIEVPSAFHKFQSITINDRTLGSYRSPSSSSTVMAHRLYYF